MKKFLIHIAIFFCMTWILATVVDVGISYSLYYNQNRLWRSWNQLYMDTTKYDLVINGNSRAWGMYSPAILDRGTGLNCFNLGIDGSSINRQLDKYHKYVENHGYPRYLLQNIDFTTMKTTSGYEREQFFPYFVVDRSLIQTIDAYEHFSWAEKYVPCYRYLGYYDVLWEAILHTNTKRHFEHIEKGYHADDKRWDGSTLESMEVVECSYEPERLEQFCRFVEEQQTHGTDVILVSAPMYAKVIEKCQNLNTIKHIYDSVATQYGLTILDYTLMDISYDTTYFYNGTHLNRTGVEIFSNRLAKDLNKMINEKTK